MKTGNEDIGPSVEVEETEKSDPLDWENLPVEYPDNELIHTELTFEHQQQIENTVKRVFTPTLIGGLKETKLREKLVFRWQKAMKR